MDFGIGIGGLSVGQDEYASDCFDSFKAVEIEKKVLKRLSKLLLALFQL